MQIIEIYKSLQGESSYTGLPCVFVRLAGCNLRCTWCDSEYTFKGGHRMTIEASRVGGASPLTRRGVSRDHRRRAPSAGTRSHSADGPLLVAGYTVLLETSGERPLERVPSRVVKIVDVKCPDSGEEGSFRMENLDSLTPGDEVKFVIASRRDYDFARGFMQEHGLPSRVGCVILSPAFRKDAAGARDVSHCLLDPQQLAEWMLADGAARAAGAADPQVYLGAVAEGRLGCQ